MKIGQFNKLGLNGSLKGLLLQRVKALCVLQA
jgi:hypothetical protein